jgi:hypothetical protein
MEAIRRAIQNSQESLTLLAKRHGINQRAVAKEGAETVADLPTGPTAARRLPLCAAADHPAFDEVIPASLLAAPWH